MFNFFKRQKATINSISIPNFGWDLAKKDESIIQWINIEDGITLSINYFDLEPNIPTITDVNTLRFFYRDNILKANGGLIETNIINLKRHQVIKNIFKVSQVPSGMIYLASLTIPFAKCSYVIKIQANELGMTGIRDSVILQKLIMKKEVYSDNDGIQNWFKDPYEDTFKSNCLMNKSEESAYDDLFPNHPLSQARRLMTEIEKNIEFEPEIQKLKPFPY